jgi:hypothetical protein
MENQLRAITPELMAGSAPNVNHRYIYLLRILYGFFTRGEHNGPGHFIDISTPYYPKTTCFPITHKFVKRNFTFFTLGPWPTAA